MTRTQPTAGGKAAMVVLANRLPFDLETLPDGTTRARQAPGGLVTALAPILARRHGAWIGWPGAADVDIPPTTADGLTLHPLRLSAEEVDRYYEGFSNTTLWPLYHDAVVDSAFHREWWDAYRKVNRHFTEAAAKVAAPGATVWIHDYQLQLAPVMLREVRPDVRIGFFLHIPFPPAELFTRLPWRSQILEGLLGADLIGFQLPGGARNFTRLTRQLLGTATSGSSISYEGRTIRVGAFPISIDAAGQSELASREQTRAAAQRLRADLGEPRKIILGVDRLDYTKGINVRLQAFSELLAAGDPAVSDTVMVQIATPSRERLGSYIRMREEIERQVGAMNGDYGRIGRPAVHYLHQSLPREELSAFYVAADVMTVTPLRDGMNLVAKEYVASRPNDDGVLLLSEFTGAAHELRSSLLVNPFDTDGVKAGLRRALMMGEPEQRRRMRTMRRQVLSHDVDRWAADFLSSLENTRDPVTAAIRQLPASLTRAVRELAGTPHLLVATDFDGTLAPIVHDPALARAQPNSVEALRLLSTLPGTEVAIVSGRPLAELRSLLGDFPPVHLIGSHGAEISDGALQTWPIALTPEQSERLARLGQALRDIIAGCDGVNLEYKPAAVAVHLRGAAGDVAERVAGKVLGGPATWDGIVTLRGKKVLELAVTATDKGLALTDLIARTHSTATIFVGDDVTDEAAFQALGPDDLTVKVGDGDSVAQFRVDDPERTADLFTVLAASRRARRH